MKNLLILVVLSASISAVFAQTSEPDVVETASFDEVVITASATDAKINDRITPKRSSVIPRKPASPDNVYSLAELEVMSKMELTEIYLGQISKLNFLLPYITFNQEDRLNPDDLIGVKIPNGRSNFSSLEKIKEQTLSINKLYNEELATLLPYSDKADIIRSIIFVQRSIKAISEGAY